MRISFTIGDGLDDESRIRGAVGYGGASVVLEMHTDAHGVALPVSRKVVIGVEEVAGCRFRRGLLVDRLQLRVASIAVLGGVPGAYYDIVSLRFSKRDRRRAQELSQRVARSMTERRPTPLMPPAQLRQELRPVA